MKRTLTASDVLEREFLEIRCRLIDVAAALDRIDRAEGADAAGAARRMADIQRALAVLADGRAERAERVQLVFSDPYDPDWRRT